MKEFYLSNEIEAFIKDMELIEDTEGLSKAKVIQCTDKDKTYFLKMQF